MSTRVLTKLARFVRDTWLVTGIVLVLLILIEGALSLGMYLIEIPDYRIHADGYQGAPWVRDYFREFHDAGRCGWQPYVYWRHRAFSGKYVNVDDRGIRYTLKAGNPAPTAPPYTVFMFGGSTVWGTGARDTRTIPSLVASGLRREGMEVNVVNFGEAGYVSTQEVIQLLLQLRQGNIPQLVVFYDGVNDTYSAYQQGVAGIPENEFHRVSAFRPSIGTLLAGAIRELPTSKLARKIVSRPQRGKTAHRTEPKNLAQEVVEMYYGNIAVVESLSKSFGFRTLFYWQPTIFGKQTLSHYESREREKLQNAEEFFLETGREIRKRSEAGTEGILKDLSDVFREVSSPLYIDWCHLGEYGNSLVAQKIVEDILPLVREGNGGT